MKQCATCGSQCDENARFCPSCGTLVSAPGEDNDALIGRVIAGNFRIMELIGVGAMGSVYKAEQISLGKIISVKVLHPHLMNDPTLSKRFHREAKAASLLNHENCIAVMDFGQTDDGLMYIAMEYLEGRDLAELLHQEFPLGDQRALAMARQICYALDEAHAANVIHRDLKPENIMVVDRRTQKDVVKVLDFGIAKLQDPGVRDSFQTMTGIVCGTPEYMAPEQARGEKLDARADLYAMGIILYQMFTNHLPFLAESAIGTVTKHLTERATPPSKLVPNLHPEIEKIILKLMEKNKNQRYSSALELCSELERVSQILYAPQVAESIRDRKTLKVDSSPGDIREKKTIVVQQSVPALAFPTPHSQPMAQAAPLASGASAGAVSTPVPQPYHASQSAELRHQSNPGGQVPSFQDLQTSYTLSDPTFAAVGRGNKAVYVVLTGLFLLLAGGIVYYLMTQRGASRAQPKRRLLEMPTPPGDGLKANQVNKNTLVSPVVKTMPPVVKTTPPVVKTTPLVVKTTPPVVKTTPPVVKTTPPVVKTTPRVVKTTQLVVKTTPPVVKTTPPVAKTTPPLMKTTPPVVKTTPPVVKKRPRPRKRTSIEDSRELERQGDRAFGRGNFSQAIAQYRRALKQRYRTSLLYKIGRCYVRTGNLSAAKHYYRLVLRRQPRHSKAAIMRAIVGP